ncbi:MAG TPA: hypothetical protein ENJ80_09020 [Gammaproteobacteria bacterium]|nr:hypothetical protein [Gammaproteobacteria bacterium]
MKTRNKVAPPVTPRIVRTQPGQQLFRYILLFCAFLLAVWFSYDYGRTQAPAGGTAQVVQSTDEAEQRITALEQERDALKQQVTELQQRVAQADRKLKAARTQARPRTPPQAQPAARDIPAAVTTESVASAPQPEPVDNTLQLDNIRIEETDSVNLFRIRFSVLHGDGDSGPVAGTIWIAVNGLVDGLPRSLSFKTLSADGRSHVKMRFDQQQDVSEDIVLPDNFRPRNILIEAKPYGDKYTGTAEKITWTTDN